MFKGDDVADTLAQVRTKEPDLERVAPQVRKLLRRCLEKDPKQRLRDIGDARSLLEEMEVGPRTLSLAGWIAEGVRLIALGILSFVHFRQTPPPGPVLHSTIAGPLNTTNLHSFAISPDGRSVAIAAHASGKLQLWLRALDALQVQPMPGTDDATYPFWSPDSRYIAFFALGKLKKIAASGGPAQSLCDAPFGRGGSWNREDIHRVFSHWLQRECNSAHIGRWRRSGRRDQEKGCIPLSRVPARRPPFSVSGQ